jgi:hypothetical protein
MKTKYIAILCFGLFGINSFGHEVLVHKAITANAAVSAFAYSSSYTNFFDIIASDGLHVADATNYLIEGSAHEDDAGKDSGGLRSYNHFYDPLDIQYGKGLSDYPPDVRVVIGNNSFVWASISNCPGINFYLPVRNVNTLNQWSWQNARGEEWLGLTAADRSDRQGALTNMFRSVGQVVHLLEDASQPQHVRNEQHTVYTPWQSPIEAWGLANVTKLNYQHSILNWKGASFTKLEDFWDRHLYNGSGTVLYNAEHGGAQLGLAEWCNGNFLGARHLYPEYYQPSDIRYYPYPSRNTSTDYLQKKSNLASGVHTLTLKNGQQVQAIYLNKTGDGVTYPDQSRFDYFGAKFPYFGMLTINDNNVLSNYHNIFIPKAVQYSAGLLDYFFRGGLHVCVGCAEMEGVSADFGLEIINTSGQDLKGGAFHLFYDDAYGVRSEITGSDFINTYSGALAANGSIEAEFNDPGDAVSYLLVYQGTIGTTSGVASDPVDADIAITAQPFKTSDLNFNCLAWDTPDIEVIEAPNTASGTFNKNQFSVHVAGPEDGGESYVADYGYQCYTGPAIDCNLKLEVTALTVTGLYPDGYVDILVLQDGHSLVSIDLDDLSMGTHNYPFTIALTDYSTIEVIVRAQAYTSGGEPAIDIEFNGTLTPAH